MACDCIKRLDDELRKEFNKWLRQNPWYYWKLEADRIGSRALRMPSFRLCGINEEDIEQWKHEVLDEIGRELDIPELRFSRDKIINGDGYVWLHSDGYLHASCLGVSPALVYGPPTLSSLADSRRLSSYLHNPIQLSPSDAEAIREHLYWQLKHYKHEEKRKK